MRRRGLDRAFAALTGACALGAASILLAIAASIAYQGFPALRWEFFTAPIRSAGAAGGILYHVLGTGILIATATAVSAPLATGIALTHSYYLPPGRARGLLSLALYTLNGVPSILFGILGLIVFVKWLGWGKSWLAGGILLGVMMLPTVTVALLERIQVLPRRYIEAAVSLGLSRSQIARSVVLRQTRGGLLTGCLLGVARAAGETAPIMFAAVVFSGADVPHGIRENPVLALPYHIFVLAQDSFAPGVTANLWGSAAVLLGFVLGLGLAALPLRLRVHEEASHG